MYIINCFMISRVPSKISFFFNFYNFIEIYICIDMSIEISIHLIHKYVHGYQYFLPW